MMSILVVVIKLKLIGDFMQYLQLYGLNGVSEAMPLPILAKAAPTINNKEFVIGQLWINTLTGANYIFGGTVGGNAIWIGSGGAGSFTSINVSTGPNVINGALSINTDVNENVLINTGTSTGDVTIGSGNAGDITISSGGTLAVGAGTDIVEIGSIGWTSDIEIFAFKVAVDAGGTTPNAAFTANAGIVAATISNLTTGAGVSGTITATNSVVKVGSSVFVNLALAGAEDATMTIDKITITNGVATIAYTNNGGDPIASDCYMSLMVIS